MKKNRLPFLLMPFLCIFFCLSCIDKDYDIKDLNETYQIASEGFIFPLGNFMEYIYSKHWDDSEVIEEGTITWNYKVKDILSPEFFDYFVYEFNGINAAIGDITLECMLSAVFEDPSNKPHLNLNVNAMILHPSEEERNWLLLGENGINIDRLMAGLPIEFKITEDQILEIKEAGASDISFIFHFEDLTSGQIDENDSALLTNVRIKSTGGVIFNF